MIGNIESQHRSIVVDDYNNHFRSLFEEGCEDSLFYSGEQWSAAQVNKLRSENRRASKINVITRRVDKISGYISDNFKDISIEAEKEDDQLLADMYNNLINRVYKKGNIGRSLKLTNKLSLITGYSYVRALLNTENRNEPFLTLEIVPFNSVIFSPNSHISDWENTEYIVTHRVMSFVDLTYEFQKYKEKILEITGMSNILNGVWSEKNSKLTTNMNQDLVNNLHELSTLYKLEIRTNKLFLSQNLGIWVKEEEMEQLTALGDVIIDSMEVKEKAYIRYEFLNSKLLFVLREPFSIPSIIPMFCYTNETAPMMKARIYGVVRNLKGIQEDINIRNSQMHDIVESQINSGWIYKEGDVENPDILRTAGQGASISVSGDVNASLKKIEPSQIPPSHAQSIQFLIQVAGESSGITSENLAKTNDSSGLSIMLQQQAQNQNITAILENVDDSMRYVGRLITYVLQLYKPDVVANILGKNVDELDPRLFLKSYVDNNLMIAMGKTSNTQRGKTLNELLEFRKVGIQISDEIIIKASSITNKGEVLEDMQKQREAAQQKEAEQTQILQAKEVSEIESEKAGAMKDQTQAVKNVADAQKTSLGL